MVIKTKIEKEIEVKIPSFYKNEYGTFHAIYSEKEAYTANKSGMLFDSNTWIPDIPKMEEISKEEWLEYVKSVKKSVVQLADKLCSEN